MAMSEQDGARPATDREGEMAHLFRALLTRDASGGLGQAPADQQLTRLAERAVVALPPRYVVAVPGTTDAARLRRGLPGVLTTSWSDCVVMLSVVPVPLRRRHGVAELAGPGRGELLAALRGARSALRTAGAVRARAMTAGEAALVGAVLDVSPDEAAVAARACFGPLLDSPRGEDLMATVSAVLTWGGAAAAARVLHLHRHTLEQRLRRFETETEADLDDPVTRLRMQLALLRLGRWPHRADQAPG